MPVMAGTSGWQYRDWRGVFYPPGVPQRRWLEYYAGQFATVENNGTFYRLPPRDTFASWRDRVTERLRHDREGQPLPHPRAAAARPGRAGPQAAGRGGRARRIGSGRCCSSFRRTCAPSRSCWPSACGSSRRRCGSRWSARHESWWTDQVRDVLVAANAALCWADRKGSAVTPLWRTADWGYLRLHEGDGAPWPSYGEPALGCVGGADRGHLAGRPTTCTSTSTTTRTAPHPATRPGWPRPSPAAAGPPGRGTAGTLTDEAAGETTLR